MGATVFWTNLDSFLAFRNTLEMQRNFGRNLGFKPVSVETKIRECFGLNYLNFRAFILPLLSGDRAAFGKTENMQIVSRTKPTASWFKIVKKYPNASNILSKAMRNILLNEICAAKRSQNLQISEFIKARENSNSFFDRNAAVSQREQAKS